MSIALKDAQRLNPLSYLHYLPRDISVTMLDLYLAGSWSFPLSVTTFRICGNYILYMHEGMLGVYDMLSRKVIVSVVLPPETLHIAMTDLEHIYVAQRQIIYRLVGKEFKRILAANVDYLEAWRAHIYISIDRAYKYMLVRYDADLSLTSRQVVYKQHGMGLGDLVITLYGSDPTGLYFRFNQLYKYDTQGQITQVVLHGSNLCTRFKHLSVCYMHYVRRLYIIDHRTGAEQILPMGGVARFTEEGMLLVAGIDNIVVYDLDGR